MGDNLKKAITKRDSPETLRLRELLNKPAPLEDVGSDPITGERLPPVSRPGIMFPTPFATNPYAQQMVKKLTDIAPNLNAHVKNVRQGPTGDLVRMFGSIGQSLGKDLDPFEHHLRAVMGKWNDDEGEIYLNPTMDNYETGPVLAHEFAHAADRRHGEGPEEAEELFKKVLGFGKSNTEDILKEIQRKLHQKGIQSNIR